jgi:iron complex outermembrane receptor protein
MMLRALLAVMAIGGLCCFQAQAQSVDYGALEQIFGEPITTSATGKPQRASDVPADMVILTQDDIRRSGADTLPDILQFVTGIDIRRYSFGDAQIGIRGYDSPFNPRLLVLVDGREVYLNDFGYVAWNTIPVQLDEIRQIEVVKGPASALFGFNAASGVINIVTFDPLHDNANAATVRGGTQGYGAGDAVATIHAGSTAGLRVSLGGWTATGFESQAGDAEPVAPRYASVNLAGRWQVTPAVLLRFGAGMTDAHTERALPDESLSPTQDQVNFLRIGTALATPIGSIDVDVYRNEGLLNFGIGDGGNSVNRVLLAKINDLLKLDPDNTVRIGVQFRRNSIYALASFGGTEAYNDYSVDGMWDWLISPGTELTNAVRLDRLLLDYSGVLTPTPGRTLAAYNNNVIAAPSFNSGLVVKMTDTDTIRLTAGRGLQLPSLIDLGLQTDVRGLYLTGSPSAVPTAVWNTELAYDHELFPLAATLTAAAFFQRNTDLLEGPGNTPIMAVGHWLVSQTMNIGSSNEMGVEVGLQGKTEGGLRWNASYRYASITEDIAHADAADPGPTANYDTGTPMHEVVLGAGYARGRWELDINGRWQSSYVDYSFVTPGFRLPLVIGNYITLNARVGYRVTDRLTLSATAEQFNVSRLVETSGETVDRRFFATATLHLR